MTQQAVPATVLSVIDRNGVLLAAPLRTRGGAGREPEIEPCCYF